MEDLLILMNKLDLIDVYGMMQPLTAENTFLKGT